MIIYYVIIIILTLVSGFSLYYIFSQKKCDKCDLGYICNESTDYKCVFQQCPTDTIFKDNKCVCEYGEDENGKCKSTGTWLNEQFKSLSEDMTKLLNTQC
jgi:hypothetical protein